MIDDFSWNEEDPLQRVEPETAKSSRALFDYALLGASRSLYKLAAQYKNLLHNGVKPAPPTSNLRQLQEWSSKFDWQRRVLIFDQIESDQELDKWEARRLELRESDWQAGAALRAKCLETLSTLPILTVQDAKEEIAETEEDGKPVKIITRTIIKAVPVTVNQIATAIKNASELQRLATDEETQIVTLRGEALDSAIERELRRLAFSGSAGAVDSPAEEEILDERKG